MNLSVFKPQFGAPAPAIQAFMPMMYAGQPMQASHQLGGIQHQQIAICPSHNREICYYCRTHQLVLCEACQYDHCVDASLPVIAGAHYPMGGGTHEIVRVEKYIADTIAHMQQQVQSFSQFLQQKKASSGQYFPGKSDQALMQYMADDRAFEDSHNAMIHRLNNFQNFTNRDKILWATQISQEFEKFYQNALAAQKKLQEYIERQQHGFDPTKAAPARQILDQHT